MNRMVLLLGVVSTVFGAGCASAPVVAGAADAPSSVLIKIRDTGVAPEPIAVAAGAEVHWANEGSRRSAAVFLPDMTLEAADCGELRPGFSRVAGGARSERLDRRVERVRLPCALPPGRYPFEVEYFDELRSGTPAIGRSAEQIDNPVRVVKGEIEVR